MRRAYGILILIVSLLPGRIAMGEKIYNGFTKRMAGYAGSSNAGEKRLAELFQEASR